jgi:hypothetical protein
MIKGQDVLVAIKLLDPWEQSMLSLGNLIGVSASQAHASFGRLCAVGLVDQKRRATQKAHFLEFMVHAVKYLFPVVVGSGDRGIPTAHSAPPLLQKLVTPSGASAYVWRSDGGKLAKGIAIEPIYKTVPLVVRHDFRAYTILAALDSLRLGKAREREIAAKIIEECIYGS